MDRDSNTLERLFDRASRSALRSLDTMIDVDQRLRDLYREIEHETPPPDGDYTTTRDDQTE